MNEPKIPEGFTRWDGMPHHSIFVEVVFRDGRTANRITYERAGQFPWAHTGAGDDIIAYRVVTQ